MSAKTSEMKELNRRRDLWFIAFVAFAVAAAILVGEAFTEIGHELLPFRSGWFIVTVFAAGAVACFWQMNRLFTNKDDFKKRWQTLLAPELWLAKVMLLSVAVGFSGSMGFFSAKNPVVRQYCGIAAIVAVATYLLAWGVYSIYNRNKINH